MVIWGPNGILINPNLGLSSVPLFGGVPEKRRATLGVSTVFRDPTPDFCQAMEPRPSRGLDHGEPRVALHAMCVARCVHSPAD